MFKMTSLSRVTSFSEKILLNKRFLDFVCPAIPDKKVIHQKGTSIFQTLEDLSDKALLKTGSTVPFEMNHDVKPVSRFSRITKPAREVGRVMIIAVVSLTASPLGVLCYGGLLAAHLINYSVGNFKSDSNLQAKKWAVIIQYSIATKKDLTCFLTGFVAAYVLVGGAAYIYLGANFLVVAPLSQAKFVLPALCVGISSALLYLSRCFGGFDPSTYIARLVGDSDTRIGLYNVLELRRKFGFVDQNGDLLKFSKTDDIPYSSFSTNKNMQNLFQLHLDAEIDLIYLVRNANSILKLNGLAEIKFQYPFNGNQIAEHLEKTVGTQHKQKFQKIIQDFKNMNYKIENSREMFYNTFLLSKSGSIFGIFEELYKEYPKSYIKSEEYKDYFSGVRISSSFLTNFYNSLTEIEAKKPFDKEPVGLDTFKLFAYRLSAGKWKLLNGEIPMKAHELLGLKADFSEDEMKKAFRIMQLALHSDKNRGNEKQADILFKAFGQIKAELEKDLKLRNEK